jgi:hypothetical protein
LEWHLLEQLEGEGGVVGIESVDLGVVHFVEFFDKVFHLLGALGAEFAAEATGEVVQFFFAGFADKAGDGDGATILHGNHGDAGSVDVAGGVGGEVGGVDFDGDFDGSATDEADESIEFDKLTDFDRGQEIDAFECGGDTGSTGEFGADSACCEVDEGEDRAAEYFAEEVGIVWGHHLGHAEFCFVDALCFHWVLSLRGLGVWARAAWGRRSGATRDWPRAGRRVRNPVYGKSWADFWARLTMLGKRELSPV